MTSFKNLSFLFVGAALILAPVAKAADPTTATTDTAAAPSANDKTLLAKPVPTKKAVAEESQCKGDKKCATGDCKCTDHQHCKFCKSGKMNKKADPGANKADGKPESKGENGAADSDKK